MPTTRSSSIDLCLQSLNITVTAKRRSQFSTALAPTVIKTTECLLQNRLNQNTAKAISLGQALLRQLFEGYRLTLFQLGQSLEKSALYQNHDTVRVIAQSIVNAGSLLARIQLNSLSHYLQQPTFFWHQLHSLYLLSEQLGTATTELPNNLGSKTSIAKLYIKILLFSCTRPHHFSRHELRTVYTQLDFWSSYAELRRGGVPGLFSLSIRPPIRVLSTATRAKSSPAI